MYMPGETGERGDETTLEFMRLGVPFAASTVGCTSLGADGSAIVTAELFDWLLTRGGCSAIGVLPHVNVLDREAELPSGPSLARVFWLAA
jgi:hypothetical protein